MPPVASDDSSVKISAPKLADVPPKLRRASTYAHSSGDVKPIFPSQSSISGDSPYTFPPTPQLIDSTPSLTPNSASTSSLSFAANGGATHVTALNNGTFAGMPLSPTVLTNFTDPNLPLPDLTSMMFPSGDPFAYPNQPMTMNYNGGDDFESKDFGIFNPNGNDSSDNTNGISNDIGSVSHSHNNSFVPPSSTFLPRNTSNGDIDVQLFGPVPMYQMQGMKHPGTAATFTDPFAGSGAGGEQNVKNEEQSGHTAEQNANGIAGMNLDELFGGEEWAGMFADVGPGPVGAVGGGSGGMRF